MTEPISTELDLTHNRAPIYVQLSTLFRRFIVTGHWPIERQVPTHETLAAQFGVNPATIRKAIALLEDEGLVRRYRRHGTFVTAKPPTADWFRIATQWDETVRAFDGLAFEILEENDADDVPVPFHAHGTLAGGYRYSRRLYRRDAAPIMIEEAYLDQTLRSKIGDAKLAQSATLKFLDDPKILQVQRADATIRFGIADMDISASLGIPLNASLAILHISVFGPGDGLAYESCGYLRGDLALISEPIQFSAHRAGWS